MKILEINCKSVLMKSKLPESDYCINPYLGCMHNCSYCYARFMRRFSNHSESWGEFVDVKVNSAEVLRKQMAHNPKRGVILIGSVTDAYQPLERKYGITRAVIQELLPYDFPISVLTKSDLVTRDIDLFRQFKDCEVGLTITTLDDKASRDFEPYASLPGKRLDALSMLREAGIKTYAFVGPILPGITKVRSIFQALQGKVEFLMAESLNTRCGNWSQIEEKVKREYPHLLANFELSRKPVFWQCVEDDTRRLSEEFDIPLKGFYRH